MAEKSAAEKSNLKNSSGERNGNDHGLLQEQRQFFELVPNGNGDDKENGSKHGYNGNRKDHLKSNAVHLSRVSVVAKVATHLDFDMARIAPMSSSLGENDGPDLGANLLHHFRQGTWAHRRGQIEHIPNHPQ